MGGDERCQLFHPQIGLRNKPLSNLETALFRVTTGDIEFFTREGASNCDGCVQFLASGVSATHWSVQRVGPDYLARRPALNWGSIALPSPETVQRLARVAISPNPSSLSSAVTKVKPRT